MWPEDPEQRLSIITRRGCELRAEAAANRSAAPRPAPNRFSGLHIHLGSALIVVGRTFADDKSSPRPIHF